MQALKDPESSLHSKLEKDSVEANEKLALVELVVPEGPELIDVSGGVVSGGGGGADVDSTTQASVAGVGSTLPSASVARTEKLWEPMLNSENALGDPHERHREASSLHWKVEPDSVAVNPKLAEFTVVGLGGSAVISVSGGAESQLWRFRQPSEIRDFADFTFECLPCPS